MLTVARIFILTLLLCISGSPIIAQGSSSTNIDCNNNKCVAYLANSTSYNHFQGEKPSLIWQLAACMQTVLNLRNVAISQKEIINDIIALSSNISAPSDLVKIIDNWKISGIIVKMRVATISPQHIKHNLAYKSPIIAVYMRGEKLMEPCILTALHYHDSGSVILPEIVVVRHAAKSAAESRRTYTWEEFKNDFYNNLVYITF